MSVEEISIAEGFKIFNSDWSCQGYQYTPGKIHVFEGMLKIAESGLHFCQKALDCLHYYKPDPKNKYGRVKAYDQVITEDDKSVTNRLEIIEEIPYERFMKLCNGILITYYNSNNSRRFKKSEIPYKDGKKCGPATEWFNNSNQIKCKSYYMDDKLHCLTEEWDSKGKPTLYQVYVRSKLRDRFKVVYKNGTYYLTNEGFLSRWGSHSFDSVNDFKKKYHNMFRLYTSSNIYDYSKDNIFLYPADPS